MLVVSDPTQQYYKVKMAHKDDGITKRVAVIRSTDQGKGIPKVQGELFKMPNTTHGITSVYQPQANSLVEHMNHKMQMIILRCNDDQQHCSKCLDSILFQFKVLYKEVWAYLQ